MINKNKKICLLDNGSMALLKFRKCFIKELVKQFDVYVIVPLFKGHYEQLMALGVKKVIDNHCLIRSSLNPFSEFKLYLFLKSTLNSIKPDITYNYTAKCFIWGSLAAKKVGVKKIYTMLPGLGYLFIDSNLSFKRKATHKLIINLYRYVAKINHKIFLINHDDYYYLKKMSVGTDGSIIVLNSEGVDLKHFLPHLYYPSIITFIMISRLLKDKGTLEYFQAASILKKKYGSKVHFKLAGGLDDNPSSLSKAEYLKIKQSNVLDCLGFIDDVRLDLSKSSVMVFPSYYREGAPVVILEAMAMSRAIITTLSPGCRESVKDGYNGFLVAVKNVTALCDAMEEFILNSGLIPIMGKNSRMLAEKKFNVNHVNNKIMNVICT